MRKEAPGFEEYVVNNYENALSGTELPDSYYTSPSTLGLITDLKLVQDEYQVDCITCAPSDFEATFAEYMSMLENAGIQTIIEERTAYYGVN